MDSKTRNQLAIASLVSAKVFGIAGLILGATQYRLVGGALLVFDGVLLLAAVVLGVSSMKTNVVVEKEQKQILRQMIQEGTLNQYLRDLQARSDESTPSLGESTPSLGT